MTKKTAMQAKKPNALKKLDTTHAKVQLWVKNLMKSKIMHPLNPATVYEKTHEIMTRSSNMQQEDKDYLNDKFQYLDDYRETHSLLCFTDTDKQKWFSMTEFTNSLIAEYSCVTPSEMTLCEMVACNYFEKLRLTNRLSATLDVSKYISHERNSYITALSKAIERVDRGYMTALSVLREIRSPTPSIHIKTNTAIVGMNQQFNTNASNHEIIES